MPDTPEQYSITHAVCLCKHSICIFVVKEHGLWIMLDSALFQTQQQATKWQSHSEGKCWGFPGEWISGNIQVCWSKKLSIASALMVLPKHLRWEAVGWLPVLQMRLWNVSERKLLMIRAKITEFSEHRLSGLEHSESQRTNTCPFLLSVLLLPPYSFVSPLPHPPFSSPSFSCLLPSILSFSLILCPLFSIHIEITEFIGVFSVQIMDILQSAHLPGSVQSLTKYLQE